MKKMIFIAAVVGAGVYLLSQNHTGIEWVDDTVANTNIQQTTDALIDEVEKRIAVVREEQHAVHQTHIDALQKRIVELEQQVAALEGSSHQVSDTTPLAYQPLKPVKGVTLDSQNVSTYVAPIVPDRQTSTERQRANLQDIAERMQNLSFSSLGNGG
ncbi:hypothetical protein [Aestuariibacter sp. A3R04]|uniref:hypothetical protein n=1 Tax=Aestuariibacter sp. A3R04 TaxID=2841571 RepID=UPI001C0A3366|nr:hypothetical protein [Aestuariibacter sp. A3R04]MBU3020514.1 hypothetical protein [Aestuariibacter sp. A3R04]